MKLRLAGVLAIVVALLFPVIVLAHGGHTHKVMGTVSSIDGSHLTIKTRDGKSATVMLDAKTKITQGKTTLTAGAIKVGDRIVAEGADDKGMLTATVVQVGTAPATRAAK